MASPPRSPPDPTARLLGESAAVQALRAQLRHLAAFDTLGNPHVPTLLLQGETGTGKGLVARVMHDSGPRAAGPFVDVNCAAIPDTLLEAELFGYEAGAFSDAKRAKPGLVEAASGGTLFLDEIDTLPLTLQGKLLTVLEAKRVRRLGAVRDQGIDVKLTAAAQTELSGAVQVGRFRADLYHRLAVVVLTLPPLRARGEDILVLARAYVQRYSAAHRVPPKPWSSDAEAWLLGHCWPGNVRELSHLMERVTLLSAEPLVDADTLARLSLPPAEPVTPTGARAPAEADQPRDEAARIRQALQAVGGNVVQAASLLGLSRGGLRYRMQRYGIAPPAQGVGPSSRPSRPAPALAPPAELPGARPPAAAPVSAPAWEQKPVVVLAIDLTFPTTVDAEALPAEPWTAARRWEHAIVEKVRGFGGTLLQRLSSLLVIAFGVPRTLEQLPQRGVQAALAVRQLVTDAQSGAAGEPVPEVRQAVHLGTMLVETRAGALTERYQAAGETLSLAVRLLGYAGPGELLVSPQVGRLVADWCALQALDAPSGAGYVLPLPPYRVEGLVTRRSPLAGWGARVLSRFVGRARELTVLDELRAQVEGGRGQVVGLVGEPGVGKSRLVYEFSRGLPASGWRILESRAAAYGQATPYQPVIEVLKTYCQVEDGEEVQATRRKVMDGLFSREGIGRQALPAVLDLLDVPVEDPEWEALDPAHRRRRIQEAVTGLMLGDSRLQPVLLVVEDLQWVDGESQAVLDRLVESLPAARLLVLASYRPESQHGWAGKTYYTQLRLDPLPPARARALLQALLGDAAELQPVARLLLERTEGNPFFLEESVRTLVEAQVLIGERGAYRPAKAIASMQVPATVQAVLAARIDRLPAEEKRLLQTAAVIGTEVPFALLEAIAETCEEDLRRGLAHLRATEYIYETSLFPERQYAFKHALTHEVAYGSLPQERRRALHARLVEVIEQRYPDRQLEQVEWLAHHTTRGDIWDKALVYLRQAGAKAVARSANREAVAYFEQALAALRHLPESQATHEQAIDLQLDLRYVLLLLGDLGKVLQYLHAADTLAEHLPDHRWRGRVAAYLSYSFWMAGDYDRAIESSQRALSMACGDAAVQVRARLALGQAYRSLGDYHRAMACFRQATEPLNGHQIREDLGIAGLPWTNIRAWEVCCLAELGTFVEGRMSGEAGVRTAEAGDDREDRVAACFGIGRLHLRQGNLHQAIPALERGLRRCREGNLPIWLPPLTSALGYTYTPAGRVSEALPLLERAVALDTSMGLMAGHALHLAWLSEAYLLAGRVEEAIACAGRALELSLRYKERGHEAWTLRLFGEVYSSYDPPAAESAEDYYRQARALAEELGMRPLAAHCHLGLGKLYDKSGRRAEARTELSAAVELYRAMEMGFWLPQAEVALTQVEGC